MTDSANPSAQQDESAVAAVRGGDAERYRELVERYERQVYAVAWSRLGDAGLAEEAAQEAFIRAYRRLWLLGDGAKFSGWVSTIARRVAINFGLRHRRELNKRERWALENFDDPAEEKSAGETDSPHSPETLRQTLAELPAAHRECLVLFYLEGKSGAEAAAALDISETALRVRLHRARAAMRERLEEKLEGSLTKLRPARTLVPAIMAGVLASSSAKAATVGGTIAAGVGAKIISAMGKTFLFSWFVPLLLLIGTLPGLIFLSIVGRMERKNFRDADGFRPELHRRFFRSFAWGFPLVFVLLVITIPSALAASGIKRQHLFMPGLVVALTLISARSLTICRNQFQVGMFAYCVIITVGISALALGWIPQSMAQLPILVATMLFFLIFKKRPARMDYSLFLRASQGLLKTSTVNDAPPRDHLDRQSLLAFARFLGSRFLVQNFSWRTEGLALRLPPVTSRFMINLAGVFMSPVSRNCSQITLAGDGTVTAQCCGTDSTDLAAMQPIQFNSRSELELAVIEAVELAWRHFRIGDVSSAERALGQVPDAEIFVTTPARSRSTRWLQWWLGGAVLLMIVLMVMDWHSSQMRMVQGRRLQGVKFSEADVRTSLARIASPGFKSGGSGSLMAAQTCEVLPPVNLFPAEAMPSVRAQFFSAPHDIRSMPPAGRIELLFGFPALQGAFLNDWFALEDFGLNEETARQAIATLPPSTRQRWVKMHEGSMNNQKGQTENFTVLATQDTARHIRCLMKLHCLDLVDGSNIVATLLRHQVLSNSLPAGRRNVSDAKLLDGTFLTFGFNPLQDTWHALVILDAFGALDRVDREACIRGILRFHHGKGLFGSVRNKDGFSIAGDARDTLCAFESLRLLGGLDRVKDLHEWQFRPFWISKSSVAGDFQELNEREIEAWVCQQRLERWLQDRRANTTKPGRSLLVP